jgi:hypothetical protein
LPSDFDILLTPSRPFEQRHRDDHLRLLPVRLLQLAPDQQVELLVGAAEFDIRLRSATES